MTELETSLIALIEACDATLSAQQRQLDAQEKELIALHHENARLATRLDELQRSLRELLSLQENSLRLLADG